MQCDCLRKFLCSEERTLNAIPTIYQGIILIRVFHPAAMQCQTVRRQSPSHNAKFILYTSPFIITEAELYLFPFSLFAPLRNRARSALLRFSGLRISFGLAVRLLLGIF